MCWTQVALFQWLKIGYSLPVLRYLVFAVISLNALWLLWMGLNQGLTLLNAKLLSFSTGIEGIDLRTTKKRMDTK